MGSRKWIWVVALAMTALAVPAHGRTEIVIDYSAGLVYPLRDGKLARGPIITNPGRVFRPGYMGTFRISEKIVDKRSNMYDIHGNPLRPGRPGAVMRYWMRLGATSQGLHYSTMFSAAGARHRSRGCYRLSKADALWLFRWASIGTPVHVVLSLRSTRYGRLISLPGLQGNGGSRALE